ncbi:hypothetical protein HU200_065932 [Digitaria exilis]|uniref:EF-hand domain-containing protein n=1 Tax=Digitaria exilis TaxID=1010633 RepID=A0A835A122_9POAL|nr:hypothetical protein HU200_065932 [Digitaria exilis]
MAVLGSREQMCIPREQMCIHGEDAHALPISPRLLLQVVAIVAIAVVAGRDDGTEGRFPAVFDASSDGQISRSELTELFKSLGHAASNVELAGMMAEADNDSFISPDEFAALNAPPLSLLASSGARRVCLRRRPKGGEIDLVVLTLLKISPPTPPPFFYHVHAAPTVRLEPTSYLPLMHHKFVVGCSDSRTQKISMDGSVRDSVRRP